MAYVMHPTMKLISDYVGLAADSVTFLLGSVAILGLIFQRKKLSLIVKLYLNNHFNQRVKKMQDNITKLHGLDYSDKAKRPEVFMILHALRGQLRPWLEQRSSLAPVYSRLDDVVEKKTKLTQAYKSELAHELEEVLEGLFLSDMSNSSGSGGD